MGNNVSVDILIVGQPNVGKSVLFSRITGIRTVVSNYAGTTISYISGNMGFEGEIYKIADAPGIYSLEPLDKAARVTDDLIDQSKRIINIIDATHLERHLPLTLELIAQKKSMVVALNMSDEARHKGIEIDVEKLEEYLGVRVIPTVARTGEGIKELIDVLMTLPPVIEKPRDKSTHPGHHPHISHHTMAENNKGHIHLEEKTVWEKIGHIVSNAQILHYHKHTLLERFEDLSVHHIWGAVVALVVLILSFSVVRMIGEFLISGGIGIIGDPWITLPFGTELFFSKVWAPIMMKLSSFLGDGSILHKILIGSLIDGEIDFMQSFGVLTSGIFIPLGAVLPYIISFYFVISLLEDTGYLPRLAVFLDSIMHKLGLHGYAIIPIFLGLGCNVPGILATRILETRFQRFIAATLISIAVPCAALQAMIIGFVGGRGLWPVALIYGILIATWFIIGFILKFTAREYQPELLIEVPPYRIPTWSALSTKMWIRIMGFIKEALPVVMGAVLVVNVLYQIHLFDYIAGVTEPVITKLWGMPKESIVPLLVGILRKDVAVGMFAPLYLTTKQLVTGCVVLSMFFPCIATFAILIRELGIRDSLKSICVMLLAVTIVGSAINFLWF